MRKQQFIDDGYRQFPPDIFHEHAKCGLQKDIRDEDDRLKYYINVYEYWKPISNTPTFTAECQFYHGDDTLDVTLHYVDSPEHVEAWMDRIWTKMGMDYDHHND